MSEGETRRIEVSEKDGVKLVRLRDERIMEETEIRELGSELTQLVEANPGIKLVVNFSGVLHLTSAVLGKLITLRRRIEKAGGKLRFCALSDETMDIFQIAKLDIFFDIDRDQQAAIESIQD